MTINCGPFSQIRPRLADISIRADMMGASQFAFPIMSATALSPVEAKKKEYSLDDIVTALRICGKDYGYAGKDCCDCPFVNHCEDLELIAAIVIQQNFLHNGWKLTDMAKNVITTLLKCHSGDCSTCVYHDVYGDDGCDRIQTTAANMIAAIDKSIVKPDWISWRNKLEKTMLNKSIKQEVDMTIIDKFFSDLRKVPYTPKSIELSADHKTMVVLWQDGTKTIVKRSENDPDDLYMAFTAAVSKKIFGTNSQIKKVISTKLNEHEHKLRKKNDIGENSESNNKEENHE